MQVCRDVFSVCWQKLFEMELCEHGPAKSSKPLVQWCERTFARTTVEKTGRRIDHVTLNAASHLCKDGTDSQDIPAPHRGKHRTSA